MKIFGKILDATILETIRTEAALAVFRSAMARRICETLGWKGAEREAPGEARQLGNDHRLEACLAIDMVVAWRLFPLTKLGREIPDAPKLVFFEEDEEGRSHIFGAQASCEQRDGWL